MVQHRLFPQPARRNPPLRERRRRGVLRVPGYEGWSTSLSKTVAFGPDARFGLQICGEAANVLDQTNPGTFGSSNNTSALFGAVTGYRDPGIIQLGGKFYF
jgi:hypothetical protein